jgi:formylglycine-generating enzyme required for sulfatase activity
MQPIDSKIKQAQRKGAGIFVLSGLVTSTVLLGFVLWLFFVKGFSLVIGPAEALPNAKVELIDGLAFIGERNIYTLGGKVSFKVSANTFQTATVNVDEQSPSTIEVILLPSPATINAQAVLGENLPKQTQYAPATQWFIDGTLVHVGSDLAYETAPGDYQLQVTNPYFQSAQETLNLVRAQVLEISPFLQSINGVLSIDSVPQGINVTIDGVVQGKTPLNFTAQGGEYLVALSSDEYITIEESIALQTGLLAPKRTYQLLPKPGVLNISARPNDGLLLINNIEYDLGEISLAANKRHKIIYEKPGYAPYVNTVNVSKDAPTNIEVQLRALFGQVTINTNVPAQVSINGNAPQASPVTVSLLSVTQQLEVFAQGYRSIKQSFTPQANKNSTINIKLLTEFEARRAQGLPLFVNTLGINMLRFNGDAFTLGSPANETGRRRNEHEVEVDFSRTFWISEKEISQAQFSRFLNAQNGASSNNAAQSKLPVTNVSWLEAAQYSNYLSQQEGLPVFYKFENGRFAGINKTANGYRLPTEAEWEWLAKKAKRASSTVYVWGNQEQLRDNIGNFADKTMKGKQLIIFDEYQDGKTGLAEVGSFKADRVGLYDLDGNASEWVHDFYTNGLPDTSKRHVDYLGAPNGDSWVIKGGNYETGRLRELRAAYREFSASAKPNVGFRIARYDSVIK